MKALKTIALALAVAASLLTTDLFAQDRKQGAPQHSQQDKAEWKAKMESAKVDYFTKELNLTEAEAKAFWPVFNKMSDARGKAFKAAGDSFKKLEDAVKNGQETDKLLEQYVKAQQRVADLNTEALAAYRKVLPADKVAKLFVIDEHFRRHMLERLGHHGQGDPKGDGPKGPKGDGPRPHGPEGQHPRGPRN